MKALIRAEVYKLYRQSRTYYALGAILIMESVILIGAYYQGSAFLDMVFSSLRESFFFQGELLNGNLMVYLILNTLWFHLPLLLMIIVSGSLSSEYKEGTLQTVFLQPVSRVRFVISKYLSGIAFTLFAVIFLMITAFCISYALFGNGELVVYLGSLHFFEPETAFLRLALAFLCGSFSMVFYSVFSLTLAILFRDGTITWILATFFLILSNLLLRLEFGKAGDLLYSKLAESWQYFFYREIDWQALFINYSLLNFYSLLVIGLGVYVFHKRDIS